MNLIFDVDDTLYNLMKPFEDTYNNMFGDKYDIPIDVLHKKYRQYSDEIFELVQHGSMTMRDLQIQRITRSLGDFGVHITEEKALEFQQQYSLNQNKIVLLEGIKEILDFAKEHNLKIGIITNGEVDHQLKKVKNLDLEKWIAEENIFVAGGSILPKPHSDVFKFVEDKMNLDPEDTYYIGDTFANDVVGAKNAGWNSIWINRRNSSIPLESEYYPDYEANSDEELLDIIKELA
ncbi:HAD family hydrolase [Intestinibacter sp.]|uniref:HAD family hydrolase n=1 Tax=Intestinibacter sp. TaxID=1965304 RepID=UPI003F176529